jgi:virulence-associated protein VagC
MARSTVFTTNRSQAVRLPKSVAFPEGVHDVDIIEIGQSRIISPAGKRWDDFWSCLSLMATIKVRHRRRSVDVARYKITAAGRTALA